MSESMSSPWIRDYLVDIAETYGAQLFNAPIVSAKKKVQLTDFLTYQENSYVWAWISDKNHRISVRISKNAADTYKTEKSRNIFDCRFSVVIITSYRPMFSPRPLGPRATGNTHISHLSLEVEQVKLMGVGGHLFGSPRDLELDENMKEWVLGLRQDGGGGNILKLRKQRELVDSKKALPSPPPPPPPPPSLCVPVSQCQVIEAMNDTAKTNTKLERPQDHRRAYTKHWRVYETTEWKFNTKEEMDEPPNSYPTPHRTPPPTPKRRQGTPTDWSPSQRGSPEVPDKVAQITLGSGVQQHDEAAVLPTTPLLLSDAEGHITVDTVITSDTRSLQPPTPAQRIRRSPPPSSMSPPRSSPEAASSFLPRSEQSCSFPPLLNSSFPLPPSPSSMIMNIRKNIQRKVPRPGLPPVRSDPTNQGSPLILVPNSDTSGAGSSQSQPSQHQLLSHSPVFPSSLVTNFDPLDASTPVEARPGSPTRRTSKMFAESLPTHRDVDEEETPSTGDKPGTEKPENNVQEREELKSPQPPALSVPKIEVLEVGTSDTEEETERLQHTVARPEAQDTRREGLDANHEDDHSCVDKIEARSVSRTSPLREALQLPALSVTQHPPSNEQGTGAASVQSSLQSPESPQSSMHSLFSEVGIILSQTPGRPTEPKKECTQETYHVHVPRHDPEPWKEPSFITRSKRKGKARTVEGPETPSEKVGEKRQRSVQSESPVKRAKLAPPEARRVVSVPTETVQRQDLGAPASGKTHASTRPATTSMDTTKTPAHTTTLQSSKPRLASLVVDFERIDLGKRMPVPIRDTEEITSISLRTGRVRTLGKKLDTDDSFLYFARE